MVAPQNNSLLQIWFLVLTFCKKKKSLKEFVIQTATCRLRGVQIFLDLFTHEYFSCDFCVVDPRARTQCIVQFQSSKEQEQENNGFSCALYLCDKQRNLNPWQRTGIQLVLVNHQTYLS
jgi:hypothetical protein